MGLSAEYRRQFGWRDWRAVLERLPTLEGRTVLDVGCGIGDQAALLSERGARVLGLDLNEDLLQVARSREIANAEFRLADLRGDLQLEVELDGVWAGFSAAYFPELGPALRRWTRCLRPGGWIALVEVDDLFGHRPLGEGSRALLEAYARDSLDAGRYDFHMGRKLAQHLRDAGFTVQETFAMEDRELAFQGPAEIAVLEAWEARLARMRLLQSFCGDGFEGVRADFMDCLGHPEHCSSATVCCTLAR